MKKTIMIFGISSMVGSALAELLKDQYRIVGTYHQNKVSLPDVLTIPCDVLDNDQVQRLIFTFRPDFTIYAAGLSSLSDCDNFPKVADALNTVGLINVAIFSERYKSQIIYFSAPYIFTGEDILSSENDTPMPNSIYGQTLASSEFYIQKSCLNYLIFRCSHIINRSYQMRETNWLEYLERKLHDNETAIMDNTLTTGYLSIDTIKDTLVTSIENGVSNRLFQLSSKDFGTRYDFAVKFAQEFGYDASLVAKGDWGFPENLDRIPSRDKESDLCYKMDISNAASFLGFPENTIEKEIKRYHARLKGRVKSTSAKGSSRGAGINYI